MKGVPSSSLALHSPPNRGRGGKEADLTSGIGWFLPRTTGPRDRRQRPAKDFPSLPWAPGKAGRKRGLGSRHAVQGWPDKEVPGVAAISQSPGSRKEGRATLTAAEIRGLA